MQETSRQFIQNHLEGAFELGAFKGTLDALLFDTNPLRYAFFSLGMRELVNHVINRLAPNSSVVQCEWWDDKDGKRTTPNRKEKMQYAIRGGLLDEFVADKLNLDLSFITDRTHLAVDKLSQYVHFDESTFDVDPATGDNFVELALFAVQRFFEDILELKNMVSEALEASLYEAISMAAINDVLVEIDYLATHYLVNESYIEEIFIASIDHQCIDVQVSGNVYVELQYGSDGDYRRGDGVKHESFYPYVVNLQLDVNDPLEFTIETDDIVVNTDSFYDNNEDEELMDIFDEDFEEDFEEDVMEHFDPNEHY